MVNQAVRGGLLISAWAAKLASAAPAGRCGFGLNWTTPEQGRAIAAIKLVHSAIFLLNSAAIVHIFVAGVRNRPSRWTSVALVVAFTEVAVFAANRGRCPLTDLVEGLGAESGRVSDIFLPRWFADRIPQLCGPLLLVGVLALVWHRCPAAHRHGPGI